MFIKRSNATMANAKVSKKICKCKYCGKPVVHSMLKEGSSDSVDNEFACPQCMDRAEYDSTKDK